MKKLMRRVYNKQAEEWVFQNFWLLPHHLRVCSLLGLNLNKFIENSAQKFFAKTRKMNALNCNSLQKAMKKREKNKTNASGLAAFLYPIKTMDWEIHKKFLSFRPSCPLKSLILNKKGCLIIIKGSIKSDGIKATRRRMQLPN
jgi:hypothetical protein